LKTDILPSAVLDQKFLREKMVSYFFSSAKSHVSVKAN
jgi:hypothetical protein